MADIAINPVSRRVQFTGNTGTGPFAFTFNILADEDIAVYKNTTLLTLTTDYTVATNADGTGSVTLVAALVSSDVLTIIGGRELERTTDFVTAGDLLAASLNEQLDSLVIMAQQLDEKLTRAVKVNPGDVFTDLELPGKDARKGTVLGFNATSGDPEAGPEIADVSTLVAITADISTLADIEDGTDATDAIQTVAGISSDVTTVSGINANVTTVAGISSDVTAVANDATDIGTVATNIASVNTVATNIADVITVANDLNEAVSEVVTVADDLNEAVSEIDTVAASISNVDAVGTNIGNVNTVAGISSNVTTVAGISSDTTTVAGISGNVTTVAGISSDVTAVAADATDIGTVATNISNVNAVAGNATNINSVAGNATNINAVAADASDIGTVAGISANVSTVAGLSSSVSALALISSDITTVAGISANVTTVAGDTANIATIATDLNGSDNIGTVAGSISNVNSVGGSISNVNTVATNLSSINDFADKYRIGATDPTTSLDEGDLFYNTTSNTLKVYTGSAWEQGVTAGSGFLPLTGGGLTGNLTFGDNNKAIFGAGSDLEIYHDGSASYVRDTGTGGLRLQAASDIRFVGNNTGENMLIATENSSVDLYYDNAKKLATTSTGVDITGTLTSSDDLTLNGGGLISSNGTSDTLVISGSNAVNTGGSITLEGNTATDASQIKFKNGSTEVMRVTGGKIGIGTSSPSYKLDVDGEIRIKTNTNGLIMQTSTSSDVNVLRITGGNNVVLRDSTNSDALTIDSGGNVGIGASSPAQSLDTTGKIRVRDGGNTTIPSIQMGASGVDGLSLPTTNNIAFITNSAERMRIDSSGNLIVGETSTSAIANGDGAYIASNGQLYASSTSSHFLNRKGSDGDIAVFRKDGTNVGSIGSVLGVDLFIAGNRGAGQRYMLNSILPCNASGTINDNTIDLGGSSNRYKDAHFSGTVNAANFNTTSDATLKTNVETLTGSLDAVKALRGVSYDWIDNGNSEVGVIAQEVEEVIPDVVSTNDQGIKSVKYGNLVGVLIEAIKEQQAQIDELKARLGD